MITLSWKEDNNDIYKYTYLDVQILNEALKRYVKLKSTDYTLLMEYAKKVKVDKVIKNYLEILL